MVCLPLAFWDVAGPSLCSCIFQSGLATLFQVVAQGVLVLLTLRFNFPLQMLTVYTDKVATTAAVSSHVTQAGFFPQKDAGSPGGGSFAWAWRRGHAAVGGGVAGAADTNHAL